MKHPVLYKINNSDEIFHLFSARRWSFDRREATRPNRLRDRRLYSRSRTFNYNTKKLDHFTNEKNHTVLIKQSSFSVLLVI